MLTILFRASADYRVRSTTFTGVGIPGSSWVCSLSAPSSSRARQTRFQPRRSPPLGFHTLPAGYISPETTCRSIPHGWHSEGLGLQSFTPTTIVDDLLVRLASTPFPPLHDFLPELDRVPCACTTAAYLFSMMLPRHQAPRHLAMTGCRLEVRSTLKLCSRCRAPRSQNGFTHSTRRYLSWPSRPFGVSLRTTLSLRSHLRDVSTSARFFCGY